MLVTNRLTYNSAEASTEFVKVLVLASLTSAILAVSIYNPYWGLAGSVFLLAAVLLGINLSWGILGLIFLLPLDPQVEVMPGFYFYFDLLFIAPVLVYLWRVVFDRVRVPWPALMLAPYVLFAMATGFSRAENLFWFSGYSVRLVIAILFMVVIAAVAHTENVTYMLGAALVPQVVYGIYQLAVGGPGSLYLLLYPHYEGQVWTDRARALFFTENNFGGYCAIVLVMLFALGLRARSVGPRFFCYATAAVGLLGLASSGSRGAWLGAIGGLMVLFFYSRASLRAKIAMAASVASAVLIASWLLYDTVARAEKLDPFTIESRLSAYLAAMLLFVQHPLIGVGLTNFQVLMSSVVEWTYDAGNAAHNTYLQILSENGSIGFFLFFGPVLYLFYRNLRKAKESTLALISSAGMTVFLIHGMFDFQFTTAPQYLFLFAILIGLASKTVLNTTVPPDSEHTPWILFKSSEHQAGRI